MKLERNLLSLTLSGALLVATAATALAHHSFDAEYDRNKPITLKGTVAKVEFFNPHVWIYLNVPDEKGVVVQWQIEGGAPNSLRRNGWSKDSVKEGTAITVEGSMSKDGSKTVNARTVATADGRRLFAGSSEGDSKAK